MLYTRTTRSNAVIKQPADDLECILHWLKPSFRTMLIDRKSGHISDDLCEPIHTLHQTFQVWDCDGLPPSSTSSQQPCHCKSGHQIQYEHFRAYPTHGHEISKMRVFKTSTPSDAEGRWTCALRSIFNWNRRRVSWAGKQLLQNYRIVTFEHEW